jgi:hypothetical protein
VPPDINAKYGAEVFDIDRTETTVKIARHVYCTKAFATLDLGLRIRSLLWSGCSLHIRATASKVTL